SSNSRDSQLRPLNVLRAYGKNALLAHRETNCLTEAMFGAAEKLGMECNRKGLLAGVSISVNILLEDLLEVKGY
ncbi:hypothetical protein JOM56_001569, partial [Amanita muscaria]